MSRRTIVPAPGRRGASVSGLVSHATKRRIESVLARVMPERGRSDAVVLCYHGVDPRHIYSSIDPSGPSFRDHLAWLSENVDVVPLDEISDAASDPVRSTPAVAITFDDGFLDNFTHALPALAELGLPATFFITTGLIDRDEHVVRHLSELWGVGGIESMNWRQIIEMDEAGMTVGAHTHTHPRLSGMMRSDVLAEMRMSKQILEDRLGKHVNSFAYPFGKPRQHLTVETVEVAEEAGFTHAVSVLYRGVRSGDAPLAIPRFPVVGDSISMLDAKIRGRLDVIGLWQERAPSWATSAISVDVSVPPTN